MKTIVKRVVELIGTPIVCFITRSILKVVNQLICSVRNHEGSAEQLVEALIMLESDYLPTLIDHWYTCRYKWSFKACLRSVMEVYKTMYKIEGLFHSYSMADF